MLLPFHTTHDLIQHGTALSVPPGAVLVVAGSTIDLLVMVSFSSFFFRFIKTVGDPRCEKSFYFGNCNYLLPGPSPKCLSFSFFLTQTF